MKVVNRTGWKTEHLRAFAWEVAKREREASERKRIKVTFTSSPSRMNGSSGFAYFRSATVRVPAKAEATEEMKLDLAVVLAHEFHHLFAGPGGRAAEIAMRRSIRFGRPRSEEDKAAQRDLYAWALALPLERKAKPEPKCPALALQLRAEQVEKKTRRWATVAKRAATALKKYRAEMQRIERKLAAIAPPSSASNPERSKS